MAIGDDRPVEGIPTDDPSPDLVPYDGAETEPEPDAPVPVPDQAPPDAPPPQGMIPARAHRRRAIERVTVRIIATGGIIGIGVALAAILGSSGVAAWTIGLVVAVVSVVLAAILWSSREL